MKSFRFWEEGGKTGEIIRQTNWVKTPLGNASLWPQNLRLALSICLNSGFPIAIYWGKEYTMLYNDAYSPIPGNKNPWAIGKPGKVVWPEIWHLIYKQFADVISTARSVKSPDTLLPMKRFGYTEECYFDYTLSPIFNEDGSVGGIFNAVVESTYRVINERRNKLLHQLAIKSHLSKTVDESFEKNARLILSSPEDIPFFMLYQVNENNPGEFFIKQQGGILPHQAEKITTAIPPALKTPHHIKELEQLTGKISSPFWEESCREALLIPLMIKDGRCAGILAAGISPGKKLDDDYRQFLETVAVHISTAISIGLNFEEEQLSKKMLLESKEQLQFTIDAAELGIWDLNPATNKFIGNPRLKDWFNLKPEEEIDLGEAIRSISNSGEVIAAINAALNASGGGNYHTEYTINHAALNRQKIVRAKGKAVFDNDGNPLRFSGILEDITAERTNANKLADSIERLEIALHAAKLGSYELDLETGIIESSNQCKANFGLSPGDTFNFDDLVKAICPEFRPYFQKQITEAIDEHKDFNAEYKITWPDGSPHWINASGRIRYSQEGKAVTMIGVTLNVTERKMLQQQKDDFIGIASHELKTPVTSIKAYAQVLEMMLQKKGDTKMAAMVGRMDVQLNRLTSLIGDLLDVTKINAGKIQFNDREFDLNSLVKEVVDDLRHSTTNHLFIEEYNAAGLLYADKERISQVIINLITNAVKYSPNSEKIIISTDVKDGEFVLCVQDFGIGIPQEKLDKVFEQFYRVSGSIQHTFPGLGLGLYISSEIIKREGGRIWVNSNEGQGSSFCFALPANRRNQ